MAARLTVASVAAQVADHDAKLDELTRGVGAILRMLAGDAKPAAMAAPEAPARVVEPAPQADNAVTCTAITRKGRRCRQTVWDKFGNPARGEAPDMGPLRNGRCKCHADVTRFVASADDEVVVTKAPVAAKPKAKAAATAKPTGERKATCLGHKRDGSPCMRSMFLDDNGFCKDHAGQPEAEQEADAIAKMQAKPAATAKPKARTVKLPAKPVLRPDDI